MGCSQSKIDTISNQSIEQDSCSKFVPSNSLSNEQSNRIVEDCIIVWFLNDSSINVVVEKAKLRHVVSTVKIFTDHDECITYIMNIRVERIFLIVPSIETCLESIQNLSQIEKIYVLHPFFREIDYTIDVPMSSNMFYDIDSLCQQLETDVELCELDLLIITASSSLSSNDIISNDAKKQEALFLYTQLMREILYRLKFENNAKNEFINFCRLHYANNYEQLSIIDHFEKNYRPQKALWWLTRQCFVWRILQRIQRTFEIDIIYKLGFLLKHAHTQLTIFQENNSFLSENLLIVYRGKTMFNDKFVALIKNNCGGLLSFNNFFIAHTDKEISLNFIRRRLTAFPNATAVLFEIHLNSTIRSTRSPFAALDKIHVDEQIERNGILFSLSTVFRINSIKEFTDNLTITIWTVKLSLVADDDQQLLRLVAPLRSSEIHANPLSYAGKLFMEMGEYAHAEQFFIEMLQDASVRSQPRRLVRVHNGLGANYMIIGDYIKALEQYRQALDVSLSYLPPIHTDLAPLYDAIGKSYFYLGDYKRAIENYEKAADIIELNGQSSNDQLISDLKIRLGNTKKLLDNE
ncbi:unnamed protein product [Rotaria sp. Silwood1]|nr:unnamed protein product [Rotaria sp. Silwood1]CAF0955927.1 unnamed protein product [Rotaria sp. Silwood1]CAF3341161.1 unnamed protein product [Rotaria sp. Silwood1]CAF3478661.1 unnamed protein product [Rotaria sp. Silwood1]CAF4880301.1 unnamed protein product [Rotaria sp. Silwood1]